MKIGDLIHHTLNQPGFPKRLGVIIKTGVYNKKRVHTVQFFDGRNPESNSFREDDLELISESR